MKWADWATLGCLAFIVLAVVLGRRKGRSQFQRHTQEVATAARAEGAAEAMAAMQASLVQSVTVVAGNDGRLDHPSSASAGILDRLRADLAVSDLPERQALLDAFDQERRELAARGVDGDMLYQRRASEAALYSDRRHREAHQLEGFPRRSAVMPEGHPHDCPCLDCERAYNEVLFGRLRRVDL